MITAEAIQEIQKTAAKAAATGPVQFFSLAQVGEPPGTYAAVRSDGSFEKLTAERAPRRSTLDSVEDLVGFVGYAIESLNHAPAIYFSESAIVAVLNDAEANPVERVTVALVTTVEFGILDEATAYDQRGFVKALRTVLFDAVGPDEAEHLADIVRVLEFAETATGKSDIKTGRDNFGNEVDRMVRSTSGADIPTRLTLNVRVFTDRILTIRHPVRCILEVDTRQRTFQLCPIGNDLEDAKTATLEQVAKVLAAADVPTFGGTP